VSTYLHESDVRPENRHPSESSEDGNECGEVSENLLRSRRDVHVGDATDSGTEEKGVVRSVPSVDAHEESRSLTFGGEGVKGTRTDVEIRVGGGEDEEEDGTVDDIGKNFDVGALNSENERRSGGRGRFLRSGEKCRIVRPYEQTDYKDRSDVEDQETPEGTLDSLGNGLARIFRFSESDSDELTTHCRTRAVVSACPSVCVRCTYCKRREQ